MNLSRRTFGKSALGSLAALLLTSIAVTLTGCSALSDLENWIPVALTSVSAIVKLLGPIVPAPVAATIVLIQAGFSALLTAIQNYKAGSGVLADVANAIAAVESAFQSFFSQLSVPSGILNTIEGLAAIILSTIQAFANEISPAPTTTSAATLRVGNQTIPYTPKKRSLRQYKSDWNAECVSTGHPEAKL